MLISKHLNIKKKNFPSEAWLYFICNVVQQVYVVLKAQSVVQRQAEGKSLKVKTCDWNVLGLQLIIIADLCRLFSWLIVLSVKCVFVWLKHKNNSAYNHTRQRKAEQITSRELLAFIYTIPIFIILSHISMVKYCCVFSATKCLQIQHY